MTLIAADVLELVNIRGWPPITVSIRAPLPLTRRRRLYLTPSLSPEPVSADPEENKAVDCAELTAVLIEVVKEPKTENQALKRQVDLPAESETG